MSDGDDGLSVLPQLSAAMAKRREQLQPGSHDTLQVVIMGVWSPVVHAWSAEIRHACITSRTTKSIFVGIICVLLYV